MAELVVSGIETYGSVSVNGVHVADTNNAYITYRLNIGHLLKPK